jgi:uncharacterized protein (DUF2062 family)
VSVSACQPPIVPLQDLRLHVALVISFRPGAHNDALLAVAFRLLLCLLKAALMSSAVHSHSNSLSHHSKSASPYHGATVSHSHSINLPDDDDDDILSPGTASAALITKQPPVMSPVAAIASPPLSSSLVATPSSSSSLSSVPGSATASAASSAPPPSWFRRRILIPFFEVLKSGATPEGIALSLSFGLTGGVFPVPAVTTVACIVLAYLFSLNFPAVQITNLLMTPVNLATFVPFIRMGEWLCRAEAVELSLALFQVDPLSAIRLFWLSLVRGVLAWLVFLPLATAALYLTLRPVIRRLMANMKFT